MCMCKRKQWIKSLLLVALWGMFCGLWAQVPSGQQNTFFTVDILRLYFLMLLFATIINRLLEYLKILLSLLDDRWHWLGRVLDFFWNNVRRRMDRLGIFYQPEQVRARLKKILLFTVMQTLAFLMGVYLAWQLHLDVFNAMDIALSPQFAVVLTGLIIGAGVEPVHAFFRIAQEKRKLKELLSKLQD